MKALFLTAATAALIFAAPSAFAADDHHNTGHPGGGGQHAGPAHTEHRTAPVHPVKASSPSHGTSHSHHGTVRTGNHTHGGNGSHVKINFNRHNVTASHKFHYRGGAYRGPSGYSYHRYSYGDYLPSIYFAQNYWISDYYDYGLAGPPDGAVWVRYGNDAVLIDQYSGEILEVVYGQFY